MKKLIRTISFAVLLAWAASCATPANTTYWKDFATGEELAAIQPGDLRIMPQDHLTIEVIGVDPSLAAPFNSGIGVYNPEAQRAGAGAGYVVDAAGNIDFPIFGQIKAEGKTAGQLQTELREKISSSGYIKEPVVNVKLDYFTVTLVKYGETQTVNVDNGKRTILQVVAPGDNEKIKDVTVLRSENGVMKSYSVNYQSKDIFSSPVFYLQQNDIVYVKPYGWKLNDSAQSIITGFSTVVGLVNTFFIVRLFYSR